MSWGMARWKSMAQMATSATSWGTPRTHPETSESASTPRWKTSIAGSMTIARGDAGGAAGAAAATVVKRARSLYIFLWETYEAVL